MPIVQCRKLFVNDFRFVSVPIFSHLFSIEAASFLSLDVAFVVPDSLGSRFTG